METIDVDNAQELRPPAQAAPGFPVLEGFQILREIGRGGMGIVYEAHEKVLNRRVALKVLNLSFANDPTHIERFEREARAAARLHHPNIVPVFGVSQQGERHFYVMQFIEGRGLDALIRELGSSPDAETVAGNTDTTMPLDGSSNDRITVRSPGSSTQSNLSRQDFRQVAQIGRQVAQALEYANSQGVLHRDIKPSNLLVDRQKNVWVADFGLAKTADSADLTRTGDLFGTLRYMAPERFQGVCDARSDVYALGLSLYELVALRPAFNEPDRYALMQQIQHDPPPRLKKLSARVPLDLETIIHKSISHEPKDRYQTAGAMADDLGRYLEGRPIQARRISTAKRVALWCRRNKWIAASIVILFLGTTISTAFAVYATMAAKAARTAEATAQTERTRAETEARISKAFTQFIQKDLLGQASPHNQARPGVKADPELKVKTILDRAAASIGERFKAEPEVEAAIRQSIGETYYQLGLNPKALHEFERALEIRERVLGNEHADTLETVNMLGMVYLAEGKHSQAEPLLLRAMNEVRKARGPHDLLSLATAHSVAQALPRSRKIARGQGAGCRAARCVSQVSPRRPHGADQRHQHPRDGARGREKMGRGRADSPRGRPGLEGSLRRRPSLYPGRDEQSGRSGRVARKSSRVRRAAQTGAFGNPAQCRRQGPRHALCTGDTRRV